ncbi:MAG: hypothetical protein ABIJ91_00335 [Candidatus Kuenenbacteria bacterium]
MLLNLFAFSLKMPDGIGQAGLETAGKMSEQMASAGFAGDLIIILTAVIVIFLFGFLLDVHNILISLVSLYMGWLAVLLFPYEVLGGSFGWIGEWWFKLVLMAAVMLLVSTVLSLTHLLRAYRKYNFFIRWIAAIINGILFTGLLTAIVMMILPANFLVQFSEMSLRVFASDIGRFVWVLLPWVGMFAARKKRRKYGGPAY